MYADAPLTCAYERETRTLYVNGTVDEITAPLMREAITSYSKDHTEDLTVDLVAVDLLPSVGVGVLAVAMREAEKHGSKMDLVASPGTVVQRVLTICGMPFRER